MVKVAMTVYTHKYTQLLLLRIKTKHLIFNSSLLRF